MIPRAAGVLALIACLSAPRAAVAQPSPYTVAQLAPGVHLVVRQVPPRGAADGNVLIVVNDDDVVVVDANIFPSSARQTIAEIRKLTSKPVRYVINTHWHDDHIYGNQAYREAYPGVEFIGHPDTRAAVIERVMPGYARNAATEYPAAIARLRTALRTGKRADGTPVAAADRGDLEATAALYEFFLADTKGIQHVPPTLTVRDSLVLHRGRRTIVVRHLGRGNTSGDLVVHLPAERIVAAGDLVVHPLPYAFGSFLRSWPATLRALMALDVDVIVPGHGEPQRDRAYVERLAALIASTWEQVERAVASGADLERTRAAVNLDAHRDAFAGTDARARAGFDRLFVTPAVEAAYRELRPEPAARP